MANDKKTTPAATPDGDPPTAGGDLVVDDPVLFDVLDHFLTD